MELTIVQLIEWHRVRAELAAKGAKLTLQRGNIDTSLLFSNQAAFHLAAAKLLKGMK